MTYSNLGQINGVDIKSEESPGGGMVVFPAGAGAASKLVIGPRLYEADYLAGTVEGRSQFGPYWWVLSGSGQRERVRREPVRLFEAQGGGCSESKGAGRTPTNTRNPSTPPPRVVAAGDSKIPGFGYDWAVISAGPPAVQGVQGKCRTAEALHTPYGLRAAGLWIVTRLPVDPANTREALDAAAAAGFDVQDLKPVTHRGCQYLGLPPLAPVPASATAEAEAPLPRSAVAAVEPPSGAGAASSAAQPAAGDGAAAAAEAGPGLQTLPQDVAEAAKEVVTREVYFDLEQGGKDLGRVVIGL